MVEGGLDWVEGDELFFAPTATQDRHGEYHTVASYDPILGRLNIVDGPFNNYHFGAMQSTADKF